LEIIDNGFVAIKTKSGKSLGIKDNSPVNGAAMIQMPYSQYNGYYHWKITSTSGALATTDLVANGMYKIKARHNTTDKMSGVENASTADGALVRQYAYSEQDKFHWYVSKVGSQFQFINRRSGKCLALLTDSASASAMGQKTCVNVSTQLFTLER